MGKHRLRLVIRPIGLSVIKEDSNVSSVETTINHVCNSLDDRQGLTMASVKSLFPLYEQEGDQNNLLLTLIGSIKSLHLKHLSLFDENINQSVSIGELLQNMLSESNLSEALHHEVCRTLDINRD
jgi:hypothetical protein